MVSVLGTVVQPGLQEWTVAFGPGEAPTQWIAIGSLRSAEVLDGRLALWDTTQIPDGLYSLRLRVILEGERPTYADRFARSLLVSNAPRTPTPVATLVPSATPTVTATPTASSTPGPTLAVDDMASPFLYVNLTDQHDPLCRDWQQRYGIWLSNLGAITLTNVVITDLLPALGDPVLADSSDGATYDAEQGAVSWAVGAMPPGTAHKLELQVAFPRWMLEGQWIVNQVLVSNDQLPFQGTQERSLLSECPWLKETQAAREVVLPTAAPSRTPTASPSATLSPLGKPTLRQSPTPLTFSIPQEQVERGLDIFTLAVAIGLGMLLVVTGVLVYRRLAKTR